MLIPCHELIKEFSTRTVVPVELDDVVASLIKRGVKDEIWYFQHADLDPAIIQAALVEWEHPDGNGGVKRVAHIDCAKTLPPDQKRLVICKEMLHLLDTEQMRVSTEEEFAKLLSRIGLPPEDQDPKLDGHQTVSDRVGIYKAVAVLFPWAARQVLLPKYQDGSLSYEDIGQIADIPARYAALAMTEYWERIHDVLLREMPDREAK